MSPLETVPGPIPGVIGFGRDLDACPHVPHCGKCNVETATRADLLGFIAVAETSPNGKVRTPGGYVLDESEARSLPAFLDRQDAALAERRAS